MKKVLIVDDEPSIVETTRFILESEGYHPLVASDGVAAMELVRQERPQVVLLDVMMPKLDGFEVCRMIREEPELKETFVLILTARGQRADEAIALEAGADAYMRKPFDEDEFLARVESVFAEAR